MTKATHNEPALQCSYIQRKEQQIAGKSKRCRNQINIPALFLIQFGLGVIMGLFVTVITP